VAMVGMTFFSFSILIPAKNTWLQVIIPIKRYGPAQDESERLQKP